MSKQIMWIMGILISFILLGLSFLIGGPFLLQGFDAMRNGVNATQFTGFQTTVGAGPVLIVLLVIIAVALSYLGIKVGQKKGE